MPVDLQELAKIQDELDKAGWKPKPGNFMLEPLNEFRALYEEKQNPVFAWWAYRYARELIKKYDFAIPEWVFEYLDDAAGRLATLGPGKDIKLDIAISLSMSPDGGQGNVFTQAQRAYTRRLLAKKLVDSARAVNPKRPKASIFEEIASEHIEVIKAISPKQKDQKHATAADLIKRWYYNSK